MPLVSYSVWGLISTSEPQHEDSIHLSLFLPPPAGRRGLWQSNIKTKSLHEKLFKGEVHLLTESLINSVFSFETTDPSTKRWLFTNRAISYFSSIVCSWLRKVLLISCEWRRYIFLNAVWYYTLLVVAVSPQTDSSHPPLGMWKKLRGSGSNFLTLIFHTSKMGTASLLPCPSVPSAHWLKVKY